MVRFNIPISDILGNAYYNYEMTSNNYNPTIDTAFTITVTVKNVFGNPIGNKSLTLYKDGANVGSATTNSSGVATWTVTLSDWVNHHFNVGNASLDLKANGWKTLVDDSNYLCQTNGKDTFFYVKIGSALSHPTTFTAFGGGAKVPSGYRPRASVTENAYNNYNILVSVKADGTVERRSMTGSAINSTLYATFYWTI